MKLILVTVGFNYQPVCMKSVLSATRKHGLILVPDTRDYVPNGGILDVSRIMKGRHRAGKSWVRSRSTEKPGTRTWPTKRSSILGHPGE